MDVLIVVTNYSFFQKLIYACFSHVVANKVKNKHFTILQSLLCLVLCSYSVSSVANIPAQSPIYDAYISHTLAQQCKQSHCALDLFDGEKLNTLATQMNEADLLFQALASSEYEVLIGNALINVNSHNNTQLVFEITTTWRSVPIDEFTMSTLSLTDAHELGALTILNAWLAHVQTNNVLEASTIYKTLQASNYLQDLIVPARIGAFIKQTSAIYRDPMQGSITRYIHPDFDDAIVDISVYPVNPFIHNHKEFTENAVEVVLNNELNNEVNQVKTLIASANIQDYRLSDVQAAYIDIAGQLQHGYTLEVQLNSQTVPVYSTQYVFLQHDKIIKLSGNVPQSLMQKLVGVSLANISVPTESTFMKKIRQG